MSAPHALQKLASPCTLCFRKCKVDRVKNKQGFCKAGSKPAVYSYTPHHGEEPPLSGQKGSGTIFFTHCNMKCVYCQNHSFSQESDFEEIGAKELAEKMLELQNLGCHNINLVSPTHYAHRIAEALEIARPNIPVVYNTGGYDSIGLIKALEGLVDIYMPDMRYSENSMADKFSSAPGYAENNRLIVKEMFRQKGVLKLDKDGIARKGVIVRLLILPGNVSGTIDTLRFLKKEVSSDIYISVMSQYHPAYLAEKHASLARRISEKEYSDVVKEAEKLGFANGWIQGYRAETDRFLGTRIKKGRFYFPGRLPPDGAKIRLDSR